MNLLKKTWNWLVRKTSTSPTHAVVEEVEETLETIEDCGEIFRQVCLDAGVTARTLDKGNLVELFREWYVGPCNRQAINSSIDAFRLAYPVANAKLNLGKF